MVVQETQLEDGRALGYSISLVVLEDSMLEELFDGEDREIIEVFETFGLADHMLWSAGRDSLRKRISEMVARFDSEHLEKRRR